MKNSCDSRGRARMQRSRLAVAASATRRDRGRTREVPRRHPGRQGPTPPEAEKFKQPKLKHGVLTIKGTEASDKIALRLQAGDPGMLQVDVGDDGSADFSFERADDREDRRRGRAGDDLVRIDESNGVFTDSIPTTIDGGDGNDTLAGGAGAETLLGGDGNDSIDGNGGNDAGLLGAGDDTFVWDPGDGSDTVEGQDGADTMLFNGADGAEQVDLSANGNRCGSSATPATSRWTPPASRRVDFNALGGADVVTVNDLTGTDVNDVNVDLAGTLGGAPATARPTASSSTAPTATDSDQRQRQTQPASPSSGLSRDGRRFSTRSRRTLLDVNGLGGDDAISAARPRRAGDRPAARRRRRQRHARRRHGRRDADRRRRQRLDRRQRRQRRRAPGRRRRHLRLGSRRRQRHDRRPGRRRHDGLQRRQRRRAGRAVREREPAQVLPRPRPTSRWTPPASRRVDFNALGGADLVTVNDLTGTDVTMSTSISPAPSAAPPATAQPTASSSTAPTATTRSTSAETRAA